MYEENYFKSNCFTPYKKKESNVYFLTFAKMPTTDDSRNYECSTPPKSYSKDYFVISTPVKKSKRRECTPYYSPEKQKEIDDLVEIKKNLSSQKEIREEFNSPIDYENDSDVILSNIKGITLLYRIDHNLKNQNVLLLVFSDNEIKNKIITEVYNSFFDGFNLRHKIFFKFIV